MRHVTYTLSDVRRDFDKTEVPCTNCGNYTSLVTIPDRGCHLCDAEKATVEIQPNP